MKKKKKAKLTAAGILSGALAASSVFLPGCNANNTLYGPPENFDPSYNDIEELYGPPEMLGALDAETETDIDVSSDYDPDDNKQVPLYGPPGSFDPSENEAMAIYGPPPTELLEPMEDESEAAEEEEKSVPSEEEADD